MKPWQKIEVGGKWKGVNAYTQCQIGLNNMVENMGKMGHV